uniref:ATPase inhibitor, mitochondrial n=1 Tax=Falco tinnunculus TaxID=100819 RepID=A0A8C4UN04_FALTI
MAAVAAAARGGLRGALVAQQQRWSSGSGADQVGAPVAGARSRVPVGAGRGCLLHHRRLSPQLGELGKGAGKGGGGGGAIREAGGAFGKKQAAEEERYFREKEREQLSALRKHHEEEIDHHKKEIERLQKEIERHKHKIRQLKDDD